MKFYGNKHRLRRKKIRAIGLVLLSISAFYVGSVFWIMLDIISVTNTGEVDTSSFIDPEIQEMEAMALEFEKTLKDNHLPMNYTLSLNWNENFTTIENYTVSGDACIWTGVALASEAFRFANALNSENTTELNEALAMVKQVLSGVALLLAVPNGGIGPEYSGILARSVLSPDFNEIPVVHYFPEYDPNDIFPGSGPYGDWLWMGYPSVDQNSGIVFGLTLAAVLVSPHDPWVANLTSLLTQQLTEHYIDTNWLLIDEGGRTTGQDLKIGYEESAFALLAVLQMAKLANPHLARYSRLYYHYTYERDYASFLKPHFPMSYFNYVNYYTTNLYMIYFFSLAAFETDPFLKAKYQEVMEESFYPAFRTSRNAWFNLAYIGVTGKNTETLALDIGDQLMRYNETFGGNRTKIPDRSGPVSEIPESQRGWPTLTKWRNFWTNNSVGRFFYGWMDSIFPTNQSGLFNQPKTVDQYQQEDFIWQSTPWLEGHHWNSEEVREDSGISYLLVYNMAKYYGIWGEFD